MNRYERQVRRLLLAYPSGWRDERGEEMVGTILDLAGEDRRHVAPRVALDLLVGGWTERARRHLRSVGPLAAGWRLTIGIAVVAQLVVSVVWLRDWTLTATPAVLPHMIGDASAITYGLALTGFAVGAIAWLTGLRRVARITGGLALTAWVLTVGVLHALSNPVWTDWVGVVAWTYLAGIATVGMFQPPPTHRRVAGATALVVLLASQLLTTGVAPISSQSSLVVTELPIPIGLLDLGADTLHTALRTGWTLFTIAGLALLRIDPRPAVAAAWLFPFLGLHHLYRGGPDRPRHGCPRRPRRGRAGGRHQPRVRPRLRPRPAHLMGPSPPPDGAVTTRGASPSVPCSPARRTQPSVRTSSASCTVFSAAPFSRLSPTTNTLRLCASPRSSRTRPTRTSSRPAAPSGVG